MTTVLTPNLRLRLSDDLTADAKYNLNRLDTIGGTTQVLTSGDVLIRSAENIQLVPKSADLGGLGRGGLVDIGSAAGQITAHRIYADVTQFEGTLRLLDLAPGGTFYLNLQFDSDGSATADRTLALNLGDGDRVLTLGADLTVATGSVTLTAASLLTGSSVTLPETGTLATLDGEETLTNKTVSGADNTLTDIAYSSLILTDSVTDSDISSAAAISRSKLAAGTASYVLVNDGSGLVSEEEFLSKERGGLGLDASALTIPSNGVLVTEDGVQTLTGKSISGSDNTISDVAYSSLVLTDSITNTDISDSAGISYAKLNLANSVTNSDISASAGIARSKLATGSADHVLINDGSGNLASEAQLAISRGGTGASTASDALNNLLPDQSGNSGKFLTTDGVDPSWVTVSGSGTVTSVGLSLPSSLLTVTESPVTISGTLTAELATQVANLVLAGPVTGPDAAPTFRSLTVADLPSDLLSSSTTDDLDEGITNLYHTDARATDAVGSALSDTSSIDLTYAGGLISADVLPAGVDHDQLLNYDSNEHIDHSSVSITTSATSGLSGGGDLTTTRSLTVDPMAATAATPDLGDIILFADVSNSNALRRASLSSIVSAGGGGKYTEDWETADGSTFSVTHGFGTLDVSVTLYDIDTLTDIHIDSIVRTDANTVQLTASTAPSGSGWRVIIRN